MMTEAAEVCTRLNRIANKIGMTLGVHLGVAEDGNQLMFTDADGDTVGDDGDELVAATAEEIEEKTFLREFANRAMYAAVVAKYDEISDSRKPKP